MASLTPPALHESLFDVSPENALLSVLRVSEHMVPTAEQVEAHVVSDFGSVVEHVTERKPQRLVFNTPARSVLHVEVAATAVSVAFTARSDDPADIMMPLPVGIIIEIPCLLSSSFIVIWLPPAVRSPDIFWLPEP